MSTALSAAKTGNEAGVALLSKALDTQDAMGASMVRMMEQSVNPGVGGNFDMSV
ncbi:MAG: YjfB family protein [Lachnospiraceae bacterium]|nr:YjfB family protein [Lachnospiraceae bacterium]MBR1523097.1 YjfB family protein [Lachnospiraceae bacterium]